MFMKRWSGITLGVFLSLFLYGCLIGKIPGVNTGSQALLPGQTKKAYLPFISQPPPKPPPGPPLASDSIYITSLDSNTLFNQGCTLGSRDLDLEGKQDSVVILHFGYPRMVNSQYGARLYYPASGATVDQIETAVEQFGYGYWYCVGADFDSHLRIGVGTSNYGGSIYSLVTAGHGQAWARMVNQVNDWFMNICTRSCDGQVDAVGASDIELSWNDYASSLDWLVGYDSANNSPLYNFGAIPGCPYFAIPGAQCGGGGFYWSKEQVWMVTYGLSPVFPLPEIYRTDGVNAQQWYLMSVYSYTNHGVKMEFIGPMSQYQACLQRGGCTGINNTAGQAWKQLYALLNGDARTDGEALPYVTDIFWLNEPLSAQASLQSPRATPAPAVSPDENLVAELQTALKSERLKAVDRKNLEEKLQLAQQLSTRSTRQTLQAAPGTKTRSQSLLANLENGTGFSTEEEIIEGSEGIVRTWEATIQNLWEGKRNGVYYQVLAGASADDAAQGLVLVIETQPDMQKRDQKYYLTSEKLGELRIVKVLGTKITLATAKGGQIYFDLKTRAFQKQ
jgi:hypothetical protein